MVLAVVLARAGVRVTVLEKHDDFVRDFRGDTVHASSLTLLDELGLGERFSAMPHRVLQRVQVPLRSGMSIRRRSQAAARAAQAHRDGAAVGSPGAAG